MIEQSMTEKIRGHLSPLYFEIENESSKHHRNPAGETHFRIIVVSEVFTGKSLVDRQRVVSALFEQERSMGLHALTMKTFTPSEWALNKNKPMIKSPTCLGE